MVASRIVRVVLVAVMSVGVVVGSSAVAQARTCTITDEVRETFEYVRMVDGTDIYVYEGSNGGRLYTNVWKGYTFDQC